MKRIYQILTLTLLTGLIWSCSDDDTNPRLPASDSIAGTTSITLTQPVSGGNDILTEATASNVWETFVWENLNTVNAVSVGGDNAYYIQVDNQTGDFSEAAKIGPFTTTTAEVTEEMINNALVTLGYYSAELVNAQARMYQKINDDIEYYSTPITFDIIGYGGEDPNAIPTLWAVGAGLPTAGWGWDSPVVLLGEDDVFSVDAEMLSGETFRFFTEEDNWGSGLNYPYYEGEGYTIDANLENANDGDSNFRFIGDSGMYKIIVDNVAKSISLEAPGSNMWIVGAGVPDAGWGWNSPIVMTETESGIFTVTANLANDTFRFFTAEGDWSSGLNYPYYEGEGYIMNSTVENGNDDDSNFRFIGEPGEYIITLDNNNKIITFQKTGVDSLWAVGAATPGGWTWDGSETELIAIGSNAWEGVFTLDNSGDANFRFFTINADWGSGLNYPYYEGEGYTIDTNLENAADDDQNFKFIGATAQYRVTVDGTNKIIALQ